MAERLTSAPTQGLPADGSTVPARLRIVGWIVLAVSLGLLAVGLTIRSALLTDVDRQANLDVAQEVDEFRTFAERGRDPETGRPFTTAERLLALYLERQFPAEGEVLVGYDREALEAGRSPLIVQEAEDPYGLLADPELVPMLVDAPASSGSTSVDGRDLRWGKAEVAAGAGSPGGTLLVVEFTGSATAEVDRVVRLVALVCLGGLVLTAAIAYVVAGQILAPVRTVRRAASRITRADLGQRIEVRGRDDVAALAVTFNAMLDRLQNAFQAQQRFASAAERHLRAPLAVVADPACGAADRDHAVHRITTILDDLDVLAASEAPGFLAPAPVDVRAMTERLAAEVRGLGPAPWEVVATADGEAVLDADRVRQAVRRLALNALQQAPVATSFQLGTRVDDGSLEVWVADDGPGLPRERAERVLERYGEADSPADQEPSGTGPGLGLAVVRAVADAHEGSAWVETAPGEGASFGLRLPLRPDAYASPAVTP